MASSPAAPLVILAVGLVLTLFSRPPWRILVVRLGTVNAFVFFLWLVLPVTAPGLPWHWFWGVPITREGVALAGLITLKTNAIFLCILSLVATTPAPALARSMFAGDRSRKQTLVDYGFRLPSALDNRPLNFEEFLGRIGQTVFVSATPGDWELQRSQGLIVEQIIRPTGLLDPKVEVRPTKGQVDDLMRRKPCFRPFRSRWGGPGCLRRWPSSNRCPWPG